MSAVYLHSVEKLGVVLLLLCCVVSGAAQTTSTAERGFNPGNSYLVADIESISLQSGNLMLNIPLGSLPPGRGGMHAGLSLHYNSKLWDMVHGEVPGMTSQALDPNEEDGGWRYGYAYRLKGDFQPGGPYKLYLVTPDGSQHQLVLPGQTDREGSVSAAIGWPTPLTLSTVDGTYLRVDVAAGGNAWTVYFPDGRRVAHNPAPGVMQRVYDRNGNYVDYVEQASDPAYDEHRTLSVIDQLGRRIVLEYEAAPNEDHVHAPGFGAGLVSRVTWKTINVRRTYKSCIQGCLPGTGSVTTNQPFRVVDKIYLPAQVGNLFYSFDYNADAVSNPSTGWGEVSRVTQPSGAFSTYAYKFDGSSSSALPMGLVNNRPVRKSLNFKREYDGAEEWAAEVWTYADTGSLGDTTRASVTRPDGGVMTEYYDYPTGVQPPPYAQRRVTMKTENPDGSVVERAYRYNVPGDPSVLHSANPYAKYEFVSVRDAAGTLVKTAVKEYSYDKNGNVTRTTEYDWVDYASVPRDGAGRPTGLPAITRPGLPPVAPQPARTSVTTYYNQAPAADSTDYEDPNIYVLSSSKPLRGLVASSEVQDGAGAAQSRSEMFYDDTEQRGNLTQTRTWDSTRGAYKTPLTASNSISVSSQYDRYGNVTLITDAGRADGTNTKTKYIYGSVGGHADLYPTEEKRADGTPVQLTTAREYDFQTGLVTRTTDVDNGVSTSTAYDALGRPTLSISAEDKPEETRTATEYHDAARRVVVRSDLSTLGDGKLVTVRHFDQLGRLRLSRTLEDASTQSATDEAAGIKVQYRYLSHAATRSSYQLISNPYRTAHSSDAVAEAAMGWKLTTSDYAGRVVRVETFGGERLPAPFAADEAEANAASTGAVVTGYDAEMVGVTDQAGRQRRSVYDGLGRLSQVVEAPNSEGYSYQTSYGYDALGNLTRVTQGEQTREFAYDSLSRLTSAKNPENGKVSYEYDPNGNVTMRRDAREVETRYTYDALNRVMERRYNDNKTPWVNYTYDLLPDAEGVLRPVDNGRGRLTEVRSGASTSRYTAFDAMGRVTESEQVTDGRAFPMGYTYDLAGNLKTRRYPSGRTVTTSYDGAVRVASVDGKLGGDGKTYASEFKYAAHGTVEAMRLGNGLWEHAAFNSRLQPERIGLGTSATDASMLRLDYGYGAANNNGNVQSQRIRAPGLDLTQTYSYDPLNRLRAVVEPNGLKPCRTLNGQPSDCNQFYRYDRYGNRNFDQGTTTLPGDLNDVVNNPEIDPATNRIKEDQRGDVAKEYEYDAAGNVTKNALGQTFTYDADNMQTSFNGGASAQRGGANYSYDGDGRRVKKVTTWGETLFVYDAGGMLVAEYTTEAQPPGTGGTKYLTTDSLGTPRVITDQARAVVSRHDYLPFGEELFAGRTQEYRTGTVRQQFTGYEKDNETGLSYAQARYYASTQGRFTSPDPLAASSKTSMPQTWNRYSYVLNNPLSLTDPSGLIWGTKDGDPNYKWFNSVEEMKAEGYSAATNFLYEINGIYYAVNPNANEWKSFVTKWAAERTYWRYTGLPPSWADAFPVLGPGRQALYDYATENYEGFVGNFFLTAVDLATLGRGSSAASGFAIAKAFATGRGKAVFWSNGDEALDAARAFANSIDGKTLDMLPGGKALSLLDNVLPDRIMQPMWNWGSRKMAEGVSGDVNTFLRGVPDATRIWLKTELQTIKSNPWARSVIEHNVP